MSTGGAATSPARDAGTLGLSDLVTTQSLSPLGRTGLDINDPSDKYKLKALPGTFSGLHLVALMYTAFRQIDPTMETGADFAAEYEAAMKLQQT